MKLNIDVLSLGNPRIVGGGGVIRDWSRRWVVGFSRKIGIVTNLLADFWAIPDGLMTCIERNLAGC